MPQSDELVVAYGRAVAEIRRRVEVFIATTWLGLREWRDDDIDNFIRQVVPVIDGAKLQTATLTNAYLATLEAQVIGELVEFAPVAADAVSTESLRGISAQEMWRRPGISTWMALSEGKSLTTAIDMGLDRALSLASTDIQLAKTHTARAAISDRKRVVGYRRVLMGPSSCGLCVVASTQRYHKKNLMPIHPGCDCAVAPIFGTSDPGRVINKRALKQVQESAFDRFGADVTGINPTDYRQFLVTHTHGEIGPVLAVRGQHFTSAAALP